MTLTTKVYDTVRVQDLEVEDRIDFCGQTHTVKAIQDTGLWLYLDLYNEDEDVTLTDEEAVPFAANIMVDLVHDVYED